MKLDIGNYSWNQTSVKGSFIGLSEGVQRKLVGNLYVFIQSQMGFYNNMPSLLGPLFSDNDAVFVSQFGFGGNIGLTFFIGKKK